MEQIISAHMREDARKPGQWERAPSWAQKDVTVISRTEINSNSRAELGGVRLSQAKVSVASGYSKVRLLR